MLSLLGHKEAENKFEDFRKKYDEFMKWTVKQAGKVMQEQEDFDEDELYGLATTALKKSMDLAEAALDAQEQQFEMVSKLITCEEEAVKERDELRRYLSHIDTKLDGLDNKLNHFGDTINKLRKDK